MIKTSLMSYEFWVVCPTCTELWMGTNYLTHLLLNHHDLEYKVVPVERFYKITTGPFTTVTTTTTSTTTSAAPGVTTVYHEGFYRA